MKDEKIYDAWREEVNKLSNNFHFEVRKSGRKYEIVLTTKIPWENYCTYATFSNQEDVRNFFRDTYRMISMYYYSLHPEDAEVKIG